MKGLVHSVVIGLVLAGYFGAPVGAFAQDPDDPKNLGWLESVCKSGLTKEDREIAAEYLAERRSELKRAPSELVSALRASGIWSNEIYGPYAQRVPERLASRLTTPKEGTFHVIFDRSLLVISSKRQKVLDIVSATGR